MRYFILFIICLSLEVGHAQQSDTAYTASQSLQIPDGLTSERSAVIVDVPLISTDFLQAGDYTTLAEKAHRSFIKMGIDPVFYVSKLNVEASPLAKKRYVKLIDKRVVKNVIFLTYKSGSYTIRIVPFDSKKGMISENTRFFYAQKKQLNELMLVLGREIRRANRPMENFLIPEEPNVVEGLSILENSLLKNYPGQLRRSMLAVEMFALEDTIGLSEQSLAEAKATNERVRRKNEELKLLMEAYPYEYELISPMSNDDLKRNRYQFVLRSVFGTAATIRQMLGYEVRPTETDFVSVIPIMPDQKTTKTIPRSALVYKYYIRQNISKNIHVGDWDADVTWQAALKNALGNLYQELNLEK